ncbi:MAG: hypothetical protein NTX59_01825 [Elusimicrobia bacterium]|nr:hypothetical protein [Elusimicrobiota bacterium]
MNKTDIRYWRVAPGQGGFLWVEQRNNNCVAVGWNETGDLGRFRNKAGFENKFLRIWGKKKRKSANVLWQFYNDVKKGDKILINSGEQIFGIGTIVGGYKFNKNLYYKHSKPIRLELNFWEPTNARELGLPQKIIKKICGLKPTISKLEADDWQKISEKLHRAKNPFKGISNYEGLPRSPASEQEVIVLFSKISPLLRMKIDAVGTRFPDAYIRTKKNRKWVTQRCEFEKSSYDFVVHGHDPKGCDMIICWKDNWKNKPKHIEIVELRAELEKLI